MLSFPIKDQADLTLALIKVTDAGWLDPASAMDQTLVKTIISELGTNIIKYATRGVIRIRRLEHMGAIDIDIEAEDKGPGIANIELAMQDRYSTGTSLGLGLPSVRRLSDVFSITSEPGMGTRVRVQKRIQGPPRMQSAMDRLSTAIEARSALPRPMKVLRSPLYEIACHVRPVPGEWVAGDVAALFELQDGLLLALADVSGHGVKANQLAADIGQFLATQAQSDVHQLMARLHERLKGTQGAAAALMYVDVRQARVHFCAVGNTGAYRVVGESWNPISKDGVLGQRLPTLMAQSAELSNGDVILMWTDGISELACKKLAIQNAYLPAEVLAHKLVTELGRPFDDASCIVFKWIA